MKINSRLSIYSLVILILMSWHISAAQKLASGPQVLTFFSSADDTEQPYGLYIPKNYDPAKKYPLVMMLHGAGSNHRLELRRVFGKSNAADETDVEASRYFPEWEDVDFIVASPLARGTAGYQGIPELDVYDVLADVKKRFNIDENRTYLTGLSMGGGGTLWIGLTRPDIWAAIAPVCAAPPAGTIDLARNASNFPVHFFHGDKDPVVPVESTRNWVSKMQDLGVEVTYKEFVDVKHDSWVNAYDDEFIFSWFNQVRNPFPNEVKFSSKFYKYNKAYWVQFDKMRSGVLSDITANFKRSNTLEIKTKELDGFTLNLLGHAKFISNQPVTFSIDGTALSAKVDSTISFVKNGAAWAINKEMITNVVEKKKGSEGPVFDAFSSRHVYVYGTADNPSEEELKKRMDVANEAANWSVYRGPFLGRMMFFPRVLSDKEVRASDFETCNLILFGTKETNVVINKYADKLPVHLNAATKDYGLLYVFPVDKHYVAISSGLPWWTGVVDQGFPFVPATHRNLSEFKDILFFKDSSKNIITEGYFTQEWKLPDAVLTPLTKSGVITVSK
ncbi:alpha/beta hydrolase-fold protein [Dyadobacter sp. CY356]|uniref:carboxylesterase family protein n=1 Tax=Dyadobacter sp. CY356 TaxID=2906442 RepID=UPI001EECC7DB|nr:alpha/beta hydrolase-fold protein [Dyadobacter sp. CY356]MCF0057339.1 phospholipase [Dyadobacter sp. CY356]